MSKEQQTVYDTIKRVREGFATPIYFEGIHYLIVPWDSAETVVFDYEGRVYTQNVMNGYCQDVLCKYHGRKIGIMTICWKDAGPNPRLYNHGGFIPFKNIYGIAIRMKELETQNSPC